MKRQHKHIIFSIFAASLVLFASLGVSINMHFCDGDLVKISLITKQSCSEKMMSTADYKMSAKKACSKSCCEDFVVEVSTDDLSKTLQSFDFQTLEFVLVDTNINFSTQLQSHSEYLIINPYLPPLVDRDITILFQKLII